MASNKFATMLHRNTNKMVVVLVYAVLEWILIVLLLLNSLFSYLITKFAKFVGLKPPCHWCSRVDLNNVLKPGNSTNLQKDLVCETHAAEISKLGYCSNHQKLAETQNMCEDCLASRPNHHENNSFGMRHRIAFLSWVSHEKHENGENVNKCSCCNESLSSHIYPPYLLMKPSWGDENYTSKGSVIVESIDDEKEGDKDIEFERNNGGEEDHDDEEVVAYEHHILSDIESFILREVGEDHSSSVSNLHSDEKDAEKYEKEDDHDLIITELDPSGSDNFMHGSHFEDRSLEVINKHFENYVDCNNHRLIPVNFIDSIISLNFESCKLNEDLEEGKQKIQTLAAESPVEAQSSVLEGEGLLTMDENAEKTSMIKLESFTNSLTLEDEALKQNSVVEVSPQRVSTKEAQTSLNDDNSVEAAAEEPGSAQVDLPQSQEPICSDECTQDDESQSSDDDSDDGAEVQNAFEKFIAQNNLSMSHSLSNNDQSSEVDMEEPDNTPQEPTCSTQCILEDQSSTSEDDTEVPKAFDEFIAQNNICPDKTSVNDNEYAEMVEKTTSVEKIQEETSHQSSKCSDSCEVEEDKLPETPSSADGLHYLHRKMMLFEKRESGAEDSGDGSVASEVEYGDPVLTIDRLKTALKAEQRALSAIYQELEEERSASAVAANQTMAMITRLQEEKAAMQMEALQYQRMMEEQAEYDQEALQLLNDLMIKREKEKQELEKELEEYRQKVMDYEAKEKLRVLRRMKDGSVSVRSRDSSCSCCNTGYTDDLSIDLNHEAREELENNGIFNHEESIHNNATVDTVSNLEEMAIDCVKHVSTLDSTLAEFEEEKASILDQLKALEEKIISLEDNEEFVDDIKLIESSSAYGERDLIEKCNFSSPEDNICSNGFSDDKYSPRRTMGSLAKRLLPYLDAADNENDEADTFERQLETESIDMQNSVPIREMDSMKVCIEEEVDRVYERLQALETDREFLHHCMGSIQNGGDKGTDLLQEILQHLRDLKAVELRMKNLGNDSL